MATARVRINLMKWESCKAFGETPEMFIDRMQSFLSGYKREANRYSDMAKVEEDADRRRYQEDQIVYYWRKVRSIDREVKKARSEM